MKNIKNYSDRLLKSQIESHKEMLKKCEPEKKQDLIDHIEELELEMKRRGH